MKIEKEYDSTTTALNGTGILSILPWSENLGWLELKEKKQVVELFDHNRELVGRKVSRALSNQTLSFWSFNNCSCQYRKTVWISNDLNESNTLWCLGQYLKVTYAELVPTGRWHRDVGRARLDAHVPTISFALGVGVGPPHETWHSSFILSSSFIFLFFN